MRPADAVRTQETRELPSGHAIPRLVRRGLVPAAVLAGTLGATTVAGASAPKPVVSTAKIAGLGTVLVASHRPLYEMASDPKGHTSCTGACTTVWIPLIVAHKALHHLGHVSGLGTIHRPNGQLQVAIHGHALYFFVGDHSLSNAGGQGFANNWFTVNSNGTLNRTTKSSGTTTTAPPTSQPGSVPSSSTTTRPKSAPMNPATTVPAGPAPTTPPTSPPPTTTPPTSPPPTTTPPTSPPTTTTTTSGGGGGVGF